MGRPKSDKTIEKILEEFLDDKEARLGQSTFDKYETIIHLYKLYLERYWPGHAHGEYDKITEAGGTYWSTFVAEDIGEGFTEFLDYFMPNKVLAGTGTMKAAGTVIKKLNKWLVEKGYSQADEAVTDRLKELGRDLGPSQDLCDRLYEWILENEPGKYGETVQGHFVISRVEIGKIWLEPIMTGSATIGPVPVPKGISKSCKAGWTSAERSRRLRKGGVSSRSGTSPRKYHKGADRLSGYGREWHGRVCIIMRQRVHKWARNSYPSPSASSSPGNPQSRSKRSRPEIPRIGSRLTGPITIAPWPACSYRDGSTPRGTTTRT